MQITNSEIKAMRELMPDYTPGLEAMDHLEKHNGDMETAFQDLWQEKNGQAMMGGDKSLLQITLKALRNELCGGQIIYDVGAGFPRPLMVFPHGT
jgi:hypothetical protein